MLDENEDRKLMQCENEAQNENEAENNMEEETESDEAWLSRARYRRQLRRQFGTTNPNDCQAAPPVMSLFGQFQNEAQSSDDEDDGEVEVLYKADVIPSGNDAIPGSDVMMESIAETSECEEVETEDEAESNDEADKSESSDEGGWIDSDAEGEEQMNPKKRRKKSSSVGSEDRNCESDADTDNSESDNDGSEVNIGGFFDMDTDYKPSGPIRMSADEIEEYQQEDGVMENRYYGFGSEDVNINDHFGFLNRVESEDDSDDDDFCMTCYSMGAGADYAFPRITPRRIEQLVRFWENDFQVRDHIYPAMGTWDSLGVAPNRVDHPAPDVRKFLAYKTLYQKWMECNRSKDQWYKKYFGHSLLEIANGHTGPSLGKQRTDSSFISICPVDISTFTPQTGGLNAQHGRYRSATSRRTAFAY